MSDPLFRETVPGVRFSHTDGGKMLMVFGDTVAPAHVATLERMDACKVGIGLAASAVGRAVYSRSLLATILVGASLAVPPSTVRVMVANGGDVYDATLHGTTETAVTVRDGETLQNVQPLQILHVSVER